jgi:hypothetical protein
VHANVRNGSQADLEQTAISCEFLLVEVLPAREAAPGARSSIVVRSVWAACFLVAGLNHARLLFQHGLFWDYGGLHPISAAYMTGLTLLDPLVAALLFIRPRIGIVATIVLIVTNVVHNLATTAHFAPAGEFLTRASHPILLSQIAFMLFVAATARIAWRGAGLNHPQVP